jgi:hypothetical protein
VLRRFRVVRLLTLVAKAFVVENLVSRLNDRCTTPCIKHGFRFVLHSRSALVAYDQSRASLRQILPNLLEPHLRAHPYRAALTLPPLSPLLARGEAAGERRVNGSWLACTPSLYQWSPKWTSSLRYFGLSPLNRFVSLRAARSAMPCGLITTRAFPLLLPSLSLSSHDRLLHYHGETKYHG